MINRKNIQRKEKSITAAIAKYTIKLKIVSLTIGLSMVSVRVIILPKITLATSTIALTAAKIKPIIEPNTFKIRISAMKVTIH